MKTYCGWTITFNPARPITGVWRAERFGVSICSGSEASLRRMIEQKYADDMAWRKERNAGPG